MEAGQGFQAVKPVCGTINAVGCDEFGSLLVLVLPGSTPGAHELPVPDCMLGAQSLV